MSLRFDVREDFIRRFLNSGTPAAARTAHILAVQMAKDTEKYVPARTKSLSNRTKVFDDTIVYPGPYARYLYYEKLMVDPETGSPYARKGALKRLTDRNLVFSKAVHAGATGHWFEASKAQNLQKWLRVAERAYAHEIRQR